MGLLGKIWVKLGLDTSDYKKGVQEADAQNDKLADGLVSVGTKIAAAFSVREIIKFGKAVTDAAEQAEGIARAFDKIATPGLLQDLRKATQGTVNDMKLMQNAVVANNFKLPLTQLASYFAFATQRAQETGQSIDYLVDSAILGLARESPMILDNLGIKLKDINAELAKGGSFGEAVGRVMINSLKDAGNEAELASIKTGKLSAAWDNLKVSLGQGAVGEFRSWLTEGLTELVRTIQMVADADDLTFFEKLMALSNPNMITKAAKAQIERNKAQSAEIAIIKEIMDGVKTEEDAVKMLAEVNKTASNERQEALKKELQRYIENATLKRQIEEDDRRAREKQRREEEQKRGFGEIPNKIREIEKLEEALKNASGIERQALVDTIALRKKELEVLKMTNEEKIKSGLSGSADISSITTGAKERDKEVEDWLKKFGEEAIKEADDAFEQNIGEILDIANQANDKLKKTLDEQQALADKFKSTIAASVAGGFQAITDAVFGVGDVNAGMVIGALLTPFGDLAIQLGTVALAAGLGIEAIKTSLTSLQGPVAIAAGIGLIALGSAIKSSVKALGTNMGSSGSTATSGGGGYIGGVGGIPSQIEVVGVIKGQDIYLSSQRYANERRR